MEDDGSGTAIKERETSIGFGRTTGWDFSLVIQLFLQAHTTRKTKNYTQI